MNDSSNKNDFPPISGPGSPGHSHTHKVIPKIKGYRILSELGEGGMGIVYLAQQLGPIQRRVALKVIKPGMDSRRVIARFEAEQHALALLDHTNIAQVYDAGVTESGLPYFAMEYVKGISINEHCDREKLSIEDRLKLFLQVCEAIQHAHQKGIIHRDIKPSNILVYFEEDKAVPKIIDFGVAKAIAQPLTEQTLFTEQGQIIGTPEYMSPEQAEMIAQDIDTRTDIYSLGVILYELLTGALPFDRISLQHAAFDEIRRIIREQDPPKPSTVLSSLGDKARTVAQSRRTEIKSLAKRLHRELEWIPLKALRKERNQRYRSASEFADDIQNYLNGSPLIAGPESASYRIKKFVRRNRALVTGVAAVLMVLIVGIVVSTIFAIGQSRARAVADEARKAEVRQRQIAESERDRANEQTETTRRALYCNTIALAHANYYRSNIADVYRLLESCPEDLRNWEWYYLLNISDHSMLTLAGHDSAITAIAISPDGSKLVSGSEDGILRLWDMATGRQIVSAEAHERKVSALAINQDGTLLVSGSFDKAIFAWNLKDFTRLRQFGNRETEVSCLKMCNNGEYVISGHQDSTISIWDIDTGKKLRAFAGHKGRITDIDVSPDNHCFVSSSTPDWYDGSVKLWDIESGRELHTLLEAQAVYFVTYTPDGKHIVTSNYGYVDCRRWDTTSFDEVPAIVKCKPLCDLVYSPDGKYVLALGKNEIAVLHRAKDGSKLRQLSGHRDRITCAVFSPDSQKVITASEDGTLKIWTTQEVIPDKEVMILRGHQDRGADCVAFSPDSACLVSAGFDRSIWLWDMATGTEKTVWSGIHGYTTAIGFSPDGQYIYTGNKHREVALYNSRSGEEIFVFPAHETQVWAAALSADGKLLVTGGWDRKVKLWNTETWDVLRVLRGHEGKIFTVTFSPDGNWLASGDEDGVIILWHLTNGERRILHAHSDQVWDVMFSPHGDSFLSCSTDKTVKIWNLTDFRIRRVLRGHQKGIRAAAFSPDGSRVVSGSYDETVKLWDTETGSEILTLHGYDNGVTDLAFSPDGKYLAAAWMGYRDGMVTVWQAARPAENLIFPLPPRKKYLREERESYRWNEYAIDLYGACDLLKARVWDGARIHIRKCRRKHRNWEWGFLQHVCRANLHPSLPLADVSAKTWWERAARVLGVHTRDVSAVAISSDGSVVASGTVGGVIKLWSFDSGECRLTLKGHNSEISRLSFSHSGEELISDSVGGIRKRWDVRTGQQRGVDSATVKQETLEFSSLDGSLKGVIESGKGVTLYRYYDNNNRKAVFLQGSNDSTNSLALGPDCRRAIGACGDGSIRVWETNTGREILRLEHVSTKPMTLGLSADGKTLVLGREKEIIILHAFPWKRSEYPGTEEMDCEDRIDMYWREYKDKYLTSEL